MTNPFAAGSAWIDGDYVPIDQARIPIADISFTRSDATYGVEISPGAILNAPRAAR
ncbi:MAG: hypothetical protein HYX63_05800 [Gammaproteobacteria bacterium]|nr:hypothetical protein [Gammaproteobacteria bacterium]